MFESSPRLIVYSNRKPLLGTAEVVMRMSDSIVIVAIVSLAMLGTVAMVMLGTYFKDRIAFGTKVKVKDIIESEVAVEATDKESKK